MRFYCLMFTSILLVVSVGVRASLPEFTQIVEDNAAAVVKINTTVTAKPQQNMPSINGIAPEQLPEMFRRLFEQGQPPQNEGGSLGSGFFVSSDGYVLTNHHVVEGADTITVRMTDRTEFDAEVVGTDPRSDLALLKVDGKGLPFVNFAEDDKIKVGEWVLAIGSPFGLDYSVSAGIVSAIGRSLPNEKNENYVPFIQTDVAINPGNSGGPLFNLEGEVVGINSQIFTRGGGSIGLSFAIPSSLAREVVRQLKENGDVDRGWLGVGIQDVDKALALSFGLDKPQGTLITFVEPSGPADKAGIAEGDIVISFDGKPIQASGDLPHIVGLTRPGSQAAVQLIRGGKTQQLTVVIGSLDKQQLKQAQAGHHDKLNRLGVAIEAAGDQLAQQWQFEGGVVITEIAPESAAARSHMQLGDVITTINGFPVDSAESFNKIVKKLPIKRSIPVRIIRQGRPGFVAIRIDK
ncbi:Periplasmic pH-dependent serine endoprotease DegQ [Sinobacterium norvegicum]|uniref:Probable periplasmic serine endoprotease DegP-like n=1 Tax=Sinobacterium norvegicum TaxID=1641715 RepID=A0ABM9AB49_9GAMM|nr:Do family serine endopeptidase [Sinobacterium norvegicum]CAH0990418.1 Periplasmic pH-dependent serine endoprotease DegQ [Sinobacterium norvegicum]